MKAEDLKEGQRIIDNPEKGILTISRVLEHDEKIYVFYEESTDSSCYDKNEILDLKLLSNSENKKNLEIKEFLKRRIETSKKYGVYGTKAEFDKGLVVNCLGLCGEAGEVVEVIKKWMRDGELDKEKLTLELGDVLVYLLLLAHHFDISIDDMIDGNDKKVKQREKNGTLNGSGDFR